MGIFDFFKKDKKAKKLSADLSLKDILPGDYLDYFMKSWKVEQAVEYDWGNNIFSREFKLNAGDEIIYLEIDEEATDNIAISKDVKLSDIDKSLKSYIIDNDNPPRELSYKGERYFYSEENIGHCYEIDSEDYSELINWTFTNEDESKFISLDRWDETDIEASAGEYAGMIEFSNIIRP